MTALPLPLLLLIFLLLNPFPSFSLTIYLSNTNSSIQLPSFYSSLGTPLMTPTMFTTLTILTTGVSPECTLPNSTSTDSSNDSKYYHGRLLVVTTALPVMTACSRSLYASPSALARVVQGLGGAGIVIAATEDVCSHRDLSV